MNIPAARSAAAALVLLLAAAFAPPAPAQDQQADAVLQAMKAATGGERWDSVSSIAWRAEVASSGLNGSAETLEDVRAGRYADRYVLGPVRGGSGFDGRTPWLLDVSGQLVLQEDTESRQEASNERYRRSLSYWYPDRHGGDRTYEGVHSEPGRSFDVVTITPHGGRPFAFWIDRDTHLLDRLVERTGTQTRTTFFTDYREIDGRRVAFAARTSIGDAKYDTLVRFTEVRFDVPLAADAFAAPASDARDFGIAGGRPSTTLPFFLENNHIYVDVRLNGKGPFRLLLDTGGSNVITPALASELGLESRGTLHGQGVGEKSVDVALTQVARIEVGEAWIENQLFAVLDFEELARVEGRPVIGLIGFEVFKRFPARIDYESSRLTLHDPQSFHYNGSGTRIPFVFKETIPVVHGAVDGIEGEFQIDTGSRGSLSLLAPFVEKHDLIGRYRPKHEGVVGWGVGGAARGHVTRAGSLRLGGLEVDAPLATLSLQKSGAFSDTYTAGNVGAGVLKRFNVVFDYGRKEMILERHARSDAPDTGDRSGLWLLESPEGFEIVDVFTGSPAARAGIKAGDVITMVDGRPVRDIGLAALRDRFRSEPPGTIVRLRIVSGDEPREIRLPLEDLV